MAKGKSLKDKIGNSRINTEKTDNVETKFIKKSSGSLNKLQISKKNNKK